jgi:prephenate dehydratase
MIRDGGLKDTAAIASARAGELFGLAALREGIQDYADNITRFLLIARDPKSLGGQGDKTSLAFALHNAPGALFKALSVFALRDIDLTKLESRPARGRPWEYVFYADLAAGRDELRCGRAIVHLAEFARWVKTLGSYPRWQNPDAGGTDSK